jgi:hypothetical protein
MTLTIRSARASDANAVATFGARIFYETYIAGQPRMSSPPTSPGLLTRTTGSRAGRSDGHDNPWSRRLRDLDRVREMALRSHSFVCRGDQEPAELWRFYVDRAFHGLGVAQLLDHTLENA